MKSIREIFEGLRAKGYSDESASIIAAQVTQFPDNCRRWGTEETTRKDVWDIINGRIPGNLPCSYVDRGGFRSSATK